MTARYQARVLTAVPDILAALSDEGVRTAASAFQSPDWLKAIFEHLAPALGATPLAIQLDDAASGELAAILPLAIRREGPLRVASFPDFGVSDYGAPLLGPASPTDPTAAEALWSAAKGAIEADLIRLSSMPRRIGSGPNPLALVRQAHAGRHAANRFVITGTVEDFLRERGKKYRKEVERCFRLLAKDGVPHFSRAETPREMASAYLVLQTQQSQRHAEKGSAYRLDEPAYAAFYEHVLSEGVPKGAAHIFKLAAGDEIVATLLGLTHNGAFTLLRISNGGQRWHHLSPGRLIVVEAMHYFVERGIRTFDMGIGDYSFKRGFGIEPEPLADLIAPLSWRAAPAAALQRGKAFVRQNPRLKALASSLSGRAH